MNKRGFFVGVLVCLILIMCCCGCVSTTAEDRGNCFTFTAEVSELLQDGGVLLKPQGDNMPQRLVVYSDNMPELAVGDLVEVAYDGKITKSEPGQIYGADIVVVELY